MDTLHYFYKAYEIYQNQVVGKGVDYDYYRRHLLAEWKDNPFGVNDAAFYGSYSDLQELLENRQEVAQHYFRKPNLKIADMQLLLDALTFTKRGEHKVEKNKKRTSTQKFSVDITYAQAQQLADFANQHHVFVGDSVTAETLLDFFKTSSTVLQANSNQDVAMFLDAVREAGMLNGNVWSVMGRKQNIISSKGGKRLKSGDLSSALTPVRESDKHKAWKIAIKAIGNKQNVD